MFTEPFKTTWQYLCIVVMKQFTTMKKLLQITIVLSVVTLLFNACGPTKTVVNGGSARNQLCGYIY